MRHKNYDKKHAIEKYPIGMEVLVENTADKQREGGKLNPAWLGPYVINKEIGEGVYELRNKKGDIVRNKVNVNRLKLYVKRLKEIKGKERGVMKLYQTQRGSVQKMVQIT